MDSQAGLLCQQGRRDFAEDGDGSLAPSARLRYHSRPTVERAESSAPTIAQMLDFRLMAPLAPG